MKLTRLAIRRLGTLVDVDLEPLGDLVVLVGRNGTGKSNVFEGLRLFFSEFQATGGESSAQAAEYLWHIRDTSKPIEIDVSIALSDNDLRGLQKALQDAGYAPQRDHPYIEATRALDYQKGWRTVRLSAFGAVLVENDAVMRNGRAIPPSPVPGWALYVFGKDDLSQEGGRELLWKNGSRTAFDSDEDFTNLAREGYLAVSTEFSGEDPGSWVTSRELEIADRTPNEAEAPELWAFFGGDDAAAPDVLERVVKSLQTAFTLIPASRHVPSSGSARASMLNPDVAYALTQLGISQARAAERTWYRIKKEIGELLGKDLESNPTQFQFWHTQIRLPHEQVGGGEQSVLQLWWHVIQAKGMVGIEEPEIHLHPGLAKRVFQAFRDKADTNQIILSTHSPMFVDKGEDACNWLFTLDNLETTAEPVKTPEQVKLMMAELGMVPSDIFLKDFVLFVEGDTEQEAVFPIWAQKMGLALRGNPRIGILGIGGDSQVIRFLRPWIEVAEYAPADYVVVLDSHAGPIRDQLERELKIDGSKIRVLSKHCIEDFYPQDLVRAALRDVFDLSNVPEEIPGQNCAEFLDRLIKEQKGNQPGWKVALGQYVASRMDAKQIPPDVRAIFDDIKKRFSPPRSRQRKQ